MATGFQLETSFPFSWSTSHSEHYYSSRERTPHFRFKVSRPDGSFVDLTDYLGFAQVDLGKLTRYGQTAGVDQVVREATFELYHDRILDPPSGASFHPLDRNSAWNQWKGQYEPLLWSRRECIFEIAMMEIGETPSDFDFVQLIHGVIGANIENVGSGGVRIQVYDQARLLQKTFITEKRTYGSESGTPVERVIQQILIDNGWSNFAADLWVPISPGFLVHPYDVQYVSVWDAIQGAIKPTAWFLGFRYNPIAGRTVLTLMEPPRQKSASSADFRLTAEDEILIQTLSISDDPIRNAAKITFIDPETNEPVTVQGYDPNGENFFPQLRNQESIDQFGLNVIPLEEDDTSFIRKIEDAVAFGSRVVSDLSWLRGTTRIECRALPSLDIFGGVTVDDDRISSTVDFYGVESVRHTFDMRDQRRHRYRTSMIASGQVIGGHKRWLELEARSGAKSPIRRGEVQRESVDPNRLEGPLTPDRQTAVIDKSKNAIVIKDGSGVDRTAFGNIQGFAWGTGQLSPNSFGLWGEQAGVYMRGYARLLSFGSAFDEDVIDVSDELNLANPQVLVAPKEMLTYFPGDPSASPKIFTDVIQGDPGVFTIKAKTILRGAFNDLPTDPTSGDERDGAWQHPQTAGPSGNKGLVTSFFQCRVHYFVAQAYTIEIWQEVTNEFDSNGDPINWVQKRHLFDQGPLFGARSRNLNWDLSLPTDEWAIRVRWDGTNPGLITNALAEITSAGYRSDGYLDINGNQIGENDPSGMSVIYIAYDQG